MFKYLQIVLLIFFTAGACLSCSDSTTNPSKITSCDDTAFSILINGPSTATLGNNFEISINVNNVTNLVSSPFYLIYDPQHISFVKATEGNFMKQDGAATSFLTSNDDKVGRIIVGNTRLGDRVGINGSGTIMTAFFKAEMQGKASFTIENSALSDGVGNIYTSLICGTSVEII